MKAKLILTDGTTVQSIPALKGKVQIKPAGTKVKVILDTRELYKAVGAVIDVTPHN